jgi:tRNA(fMet)-specific endonuclease VapC
VARLILDTGVLIDAVRDRVDLAALAGDDDVAIPAVAVAEYLLGPELDHDQRRAATQRAFLASVLAFLPVEPYDRTVAEHHAALMAFARRQASPRGRRDLIIAATARATSRILLTTDAGARFDELPGVAVRLLKQGPPPA